MKRWTSIATANEDPRWLLLSSHLRALGAENEYVPWPGDAEAQTDLDALDGLFHVRLSTRVGPRMLKNLKAQSSWITLLGVIDGMIARDRRWWPLCALYESFGQVLVRVGQHLDYRGNVFVAGAGGAARTAIVAFFKAGFKRFFVTNSDEAEAQSMIDDIRTKFFGLSIQFVPIEKIVLLGADTSALVNCTPDTGNNPLIVELSYLNFLKRTGYLFDLARSRAPNVLVAEAMDAGVNVINGIEIGARSDVLWARWAFEKDVNYETYCRELTERLP